MFNRKDQNRKALIPLNTSLSELWRVLKTERASLSLYRRSLCLSINSVVYFVTLPIAPHAIIPGPGIGENLKKCGLGNYPYICIETRREIHGKPSGYLVSGPRFEIQTSLIWRRCFNHSDVRWFCSSQKGTWAMRTYSVEITSPTHKCDAGIKMRS